jgi:hypothetical protein
MISRSYEVEIKIGFDGGSEVILRVPTTIVAKPATSAAEAAFDNAIRIADNWVPPGRGTAADEVEPELLRPAAFNLNINDPESSDASDTDSESVEIAHAADPIENVPLESPPEYAPVITSVNGKEVVEHHFYAVVA